MAIPRLLEKPQRRDVIMVQVKENKMTGFLP